TEYFYLDFTSATSTDPDAIFDLQSYTTYGYLYDNDFAVEIQVVAQDIYESEGSILFDIYRSGETNVDATVNFIIEAAPFNSPDAADFSETFPKIGSVTFAAGETQKSVSLAVIDDDLVENDEVVEFNITSATSTDPSAVFSYSSLTYVYIYNDDEPVEFMVSGSSEAEGSGNPLTFTVTRYGNTDVAAVVSYGFQGWPTDPVTGDDLVNGFPTGGQLNFAAGETTKTFSFDIADDADSEGDEQLGLRILSIDAGGASTTGTGSIGYATIENDDFYVQISIDGAEGYEDDGPITITFRRSGNTTPAVDVDYRIYSGAYASAASNDDIVETLPLTGTVSFAAGATTATITIDPVADSLVEADEYLEIVTTDARTSDGSVAIRQTSPSYVAILNDDLNVEVSVVGAAGNEDDGPISATIYRTGRTDEVVTVYYEITAFDVEPEDLAEALPIMASVTFQPGETSKTVDITPIADTDIESDEYVVVSLTDVELPQDSDAQVLFQTFPAYVQIINDDLPVTFTARSTSTTEGDELVYRIYRTGQTDIAASVDWTLATYDTETGDFVDGLPQTGSLDFAAGETFKLISFATVDDEIVEGTESALLTLSNPQAAYGWPVVVGNYPAWGSINDNDFDIIIRVSSASAYEDSGPLGFVFTRSGEVNANVTVDYELSDYIFSTTTTSADLVGGLPQIGSVHFAAFETTKIVYFDIVADDIVEPTETVEMILTGASTTSSHNIDLQYYSSFGYIYNDDYNIDLHPWTNSAYEGDDLVFHIYRYGHTADAVTVDYTIDFGISGTPASASDLSGGLPNSGQVTFAAGETVKTIILGTVEDSLIEADESVTLTIDSAYSASAKPITGIGLSSTSYIWNDDFAVRFSVYGQSAYEDTGVLIYTVYRSGNTAVAASIGYSFDGGLGAGYATSDDVEGGLPQSGILEFAAGETSKFITVVPNFDTDIETSEAIALSLMDPVVPDGVEVVVPSSPALAYIYNDDYPASV
ncbi:MAG: Calx-beta domain-containing protein, partial [Mangrovicoccus sp.]